MGRKRLTEDQGMLATSEVAAVAGVPEATLDNWIRTGLVPVEIEAEGRGTARSWTLEDAAAAVQVARLRREGVSLQRIRRAAAALEQQGEERPLSRCCLRTDGSRVYRRRGDEGAMEEVATGQTMSRYLRREVEEAARRELVPLPSREPAIKTSKRRKRRGKSATG